MRRIKPQKTGSPSDIEDGRPGPGAPASSVAEKLRRLELISEIFEICNATPNLNELMDKVFNKVVQDVNAEAGSLWLIDEKTEENTCYVAEGPTKGKIVGLKLPKGTGVIGAVIDTGESETVYDAANDPRFSSSVDEKTGFRTRSMICAPLMVEGKAIGAIQLLNQKSKSGKFNDQDLNLLKLLCQSSATPIVNARLQASQQKAEELSSLLEISKEITSTLDLDRCMLSVVNLCSKLIPYDRAAVALLDKKGINVAAVSGQMEVNRDDPDIINLRSLLDSVNKSGNDLYVPVAKKYLKENNRTKSVEEYLNRYHQGSLAVFRLFDDESDLGLFMMESKKEHLISASLFERIELLKNMLTVTLRNAQLYNSVPKLSLFNRQGKNFKVKKALTIATVVGLAVLGAAFITTENRTEGKVEVMPNTKYQLYSRVDGMVEWAREHPEQPIAAGDTLMKFKTDDLKQEYRKQKNKLVMLKQEMGRQTLESRHTDLMLSRIKLKQARLELVGIKRKILESVVVSPVAGRLVDETSADLTGRRFSRGDELLEVVELGQYRVKIMVPENQIYQVNPGQDAIFRVPAFPGITFRGTVQQTTYQTVEENGKVYYPVLLSIVGANEGLLPGMTGRGKITIGARSLLDRLIEKPKQFILTKFWL